MRRTINPTQELIDAALALVDRHIDHRIGSSICRYCHWASLTSSPIQHGASCVVGAVVAAVQRQQQVLSEDGSKKGVGFPLSEHQQRVLSADALALGEQQVLRRASLAQDDSGQKVCLHCGPSCLGGAEHNARREDGVVWSASLAQDDSPVMKRVERQLAALDAVERHIVYDEPRCVYCGAVRAAHSFEKAHCLDVETGVVRRPVRVFVAEVSR